MKILPTAGKIRAIATTGRLLIVHLLVGRAQNSSLINHACATFASTVKYVIKIILGKGKKSNVQKEIRA